MLIQEVLMKDNLIFLLLSGVVVLSMIAGMETGKWKKAAEVRHSYLKAEIARVKQERDLYKTMVEFFFTDSCMKKGLFKITGYDLSYRSCGKWAKHRKTASGTTPHPFRTVAVDPRVIPIGSLLYISGLGWFIAEDTGSAIKGNRVDVFFDSTKEAVLFGVKEAEVFYYDRRCITRLVRKNIYSRKLSF